MYAQSLKFNFIVSSWWPILHEIYIYNFDFQLLFLKIKQSREFLPTFEACSRVCMNTIILWTLPSISKGPAFDRFLPINIHFQWSFHHVIPDFSFHICSVFNISNLVWKLLPISIICTNTTTSGLIFHYHSFCLPLLNNKTPTQSKAYILQ